MTKAQRNVLSTLASRKQWGSWVLESYDGRTVNSLFTHGWIEFPTWGPTPADARMDIVRATDTGRAALAAEK